MAQPTPAIRCDATLRAIGGGTVLHLPEKASARLPSRGQVAVHGAINGVTFDTVLEPDGSGGHWMKVDRELRHAARVSAGDAATLHLEPADGWPEPTVPEDLEVALAAAPQRIRDLWKAITPIGDPLRRSPGRRVVAQTCIRAVRYSVAAGARSRATPDQAR